MKRAPRNPHSNKLNQRGFSLLEIIIASALSGLIAYGFVNVLIMMNSGPRFLEQKLSGHSVRRELMLKILNDDNLRKTIEKNPEMACLANSTPCDPQLVRKIDLYEHDVKTSVTKVYYASATKDDAGFDDRGRPCEGFSADAGNPNCPYRVDLYWIPVCPTNTSCNPVQYRLQAKFHFANGAKDKQPYAVSMLDFDMIRNFKIQRTPKLLASGQKHNCLVIDDTSVVCWGSNASGQLGAGAAVPIGSSSDKPVAVRTATGRLLGVDQVVSGADHSCARTTNGKMWCWGANGGGELGQGVFGPASGIALPVQIPSPGNPAVLIDLQGVTKVHAAYENSCATLDTGDVLCWGYGRDRRLPRTWQARAELPATYFNSAANPPYLHGGSSVPISIFKYSEGLLPAEIYAGYQTKTVPEFFIGTRNSCIVYPSDRSLNCWGSNQYSELMLLNQHQIPSPHDITNADDLLDMSPTFKFWSPGGTPGPMAGVKDVKTGLRFTCALVDAGGGDNSIACWGYNYVGQIGNGFTRPYPPLYLDGDPYPPEPGANWWGWHGTVETWDSGTNAPPPTGTFSPVTAEPRPTWVANETGTPGSKLTNIRDFSVGWEHACAIRTNQDVYCWGRGGSGQLGDGTSSATYSRSYPGQVIGLAGMRAMEVSAGEFHTCALFTDKSVMCWGHNSDGQLGKGDGSTSSSPAPVRVFGF